MVLSQTLPLALAALVLEAVVGYPAPLYRVAGHPVTWMGAWLDWLEKRLNRPGMGFFDRRALGALALGVYVAPVALGCVAATRLLAPLGAVGFVILTVMAASLPAQRSLYAHARTVADGLDKSLDEGRRAVAMIVGRNPKVLDASGVARAAIESLAENFPDGIVAPVCWTALGGLAGGALYKAVNTADSMIGHKDERFAAFGWAAARLDDLVNLPASRLAALWLVLAAWLAPGASPSRQPAPCATMHENTARPTPDGRRRQWLARSASSSQGPAFMERRWWKTPSWETAGARRLPPTSVAPSTSTGSPASFRALRLRRRRSLCSFEHRIAIKMRFEMVGESSSVRSTVVS